MVEAFSTLNGWAKKENSYLELFDMLVFVGISSNRALYDPKSKNSEVDFALVQGGSTTTKNTGTKLIRNGDYVMWTLPDPADCTAQSRINIPIEPYNAETMKMSKKLIHETLMNTETNNRYNSTEKDLRKPLVDGANALYTGLSRALLVGVHALMNAGIIQVVDNDFASILTDDNYEARKQNSSAFAEASEEDKIFFFKNLARAIGAYTDDTKFDVMVAPVIDKHDTSNQEENMDLSHLVINTFFPSEDKKFEIFNVSNAVMGHAGDEADLVRMQLSFVENVIDGITRTNEFYTNRIIGKAVTVASPGQHFDILLSKYMI